MNTKVYVDNLDAETTEREIIILFSAFGNVAKVNIATDPTNRNPRGFGFVTMVTPEGARAAIQGLNGKRTGSGILTVGEGWLNEDGGAPRNGRGSPRRLSCSRRQ